MEELDAFLANPRNAEWRDTMQAKVAESILMGIAQCSPVRPFGGPNPVDVYAALVRKCKAKATEATMSPAIKDNLLAALVDASAKVVALQESLRHVQAAAAKTTLDGSSYYANECAREALVIHQRLEHVETQAKQWKPEKKP